ncbi:MAG: hypothetical protein H6809_02085 [Phycisphaeraceae bacterium]|nr:hypothetical protein [Phycisphaeraceae bacterium]
MDIVVSPYHLTTREAPAMAALQLADRAITMMPTPFAGTAKRDVEGAVAAAPKYMAFMESWRWAAPLWEAGVLAPSVDGLDAAGDVREAFDRIGADDRYADLRPLMKPHVFEHERDYLQAIAGDVLKGGPDPAISVPVAAGMDRFAARHGLAVARAFPASVSQKAEARLGQRLGAFAVPFLAQGAAERVLDLRDELADVLDDLRAALGAVIDSGGALLAGPTGGPMGDVEIAARAYTRAFDDLRDDLCALAGPDEPRVVSATLAVSVVRLPGGAVLDASVAAMRAVGMGSRRRAPGNGHAAVAEGSTLPSVWDPGVAPVVTLVFKVIGRG